MILTYTGDPRRCVGYPRVEGMNALAGRVLRWQIGRRWQKALKTPAQTLILSAESLLTNLRGPELATLLHDLRQSFDEVRLLVYIRPYHDLVSSLWQQRLRRGVADLKITSQPYRKILEPGLQVFGRENIIFRRFSRKDLLQGDLFADFCAQTGLPDGALRDTGTKFESLSLEAASVLFAHNLERKAKMGHAEARAVEERARLTAVLERFGHEKIGFSEKLLQQALQRRAEGLDWLEGVAGFDVRGKAQSVAQPIDSAGDLLRLAEKHRPEVEEMLSRAKPPAGPIRRALMRRWL
ncbi:hypothetical protein [Neogemmobacter tilapiae]|uniref:hypothetical protein n=1 Tax=Neogemmobacter tilapiae TaxID=875041 RepID=UPI001672E410|nr:hypothetical protein [Gemmobacter tilapiae]